jgi:hypothetical protein
MLLQNCLSWKPDRRAAALLALAALPCAGLPAMEASGETETGMRFHGEVVGLREESLQLRFTGNTEAAPVGIPIVSIKSVQLSLPDPAGPELGNALETLLPLLPLCDGATLMAVLDWARSLGKAADWPGAYLWATRLAGLIRSPESKIEAGLLEAEALLEMGLNRRLGARLEELNTQVDPLGAPLLLCALNARYFRWQGDAEKARFWAELPALQVPSKRGPLADQLAALASDLNNEPTSP